MLHWARENGCEWDIDTRFAAAQCGHMEVLPWAVSSCCEWVSRTCYQLAQPSSARGGPATGNSVGCVAAGGNWATL